MEYIGYLASLLIGVSLGLTGSGGSILTVPILVYGLGLSPVLATSYSLFVVGTTSMVGGARFFRQGLVHFPSVLAFGLPSLVTVYLTRRWLLPAIPAQLWTLEAFTLSREMGVMMLFAVLMVLASYSMIKGDCCQHWKINTRAPALYPVLAALAIGLGGVSGLVGAGGGFLIIPVLVIGLHLDMKMAVGTSLAIIAINSLVGFAGDILHYVMDWAFLLTFSAFSVAGIFIGTALAPKAESRKLKQAFGWFVLAMGLAVVGKEILRL
jgi:uncharacterized membrane protein YfcA